MSDESAQSEPLYPERLTWAVLLGRWIEFARSAVALPPTEAGKRLRDSVADLIMLQAVWFALQHLEQLDDDERALGLDRAALLIEKHVNAVEHRYGDEPLPQQLSELIADARAQWHVANG